MTAAASQPKVEKKIMEEKIAKVREVVKNVSTNDIVLALHNFELDVARTIHTFCEGGADVALGDWERTGGAKKRNHKKKAKTTTGRGVDVSVGTDGAKTRMGRGLDVPVGFDVVKATTGRGVDVSVGIDGCSFGLVDYKSQLAQNRDMFEREVSTAEEAICQCFKELRDVLAIREKRLMDELAKCRNDAHRYFDLRTNTLRSLIADSASAQRKSSSSFMANLEKFNAKKTDDLEVALTARFLYNLSSITLSINQLGTVPAVLNIADDAVTFALTNGDKSLSKIAAASAVPEPPRIENAVKRSNSPSSLVSSVGEDSGLGGQISPVNHVDKGPLVQVEGNAISPVNHVEKGQSVQVEENGISPVNHAEKGPSVQVEENGIVLKSDSVSADQLAEIQRQIAESLKAKGIDPAVLANFSSATVAARRRAPPKKHL